MTSPNTSEGRPQGAFRVSDGVVVEDSDDVSGNGTSEVTEPPGEVVTEGVSDSAGEVTSTEEVEQALGAGDDVASALGEVAGEPSVGSADPEGSRINTQTHECTETDSTSELSIAEITSHKPRDKLVEQTAQDPSLETIRCLADLEEQGYQWDKGILVRHRLDECGDAYRQLCLPSQLRLQCLTLAHERFDHWGRNKMSQCIRKLFYWPSMFSDIAKHCRSCDTCQRRTKIMPKPCPVQEREVVSIPFERVCIDLVGSFPKAKGGFEYPPDIY